MIVIISVLELHWVIVNSNLICGASFFKDMSLERLFLLQAGEFWSHYQIQAAQCWGNATQFVLDQCCFFSLSAVLCCKCTYSPAVSLGIVLINPVGLFNLSPTPWLSLYSYPCRCFDIPKKVIPCIASSDIYNTPPKTSPTKTRTRLEGRLVAEPSVKCKLQRYR